MESPPLPPPLRQKAKIRNGVKGGLIAAGALAVGVLLCGGVLWAYVAFAKDFTPTEPQRACLVTGKELKERFELADDHAVETLECKIYFDRSVELFYLYHDDAEGVQVDCTLSIERKTSDALTAYVVAWQAFKLGLRSEDFPIDLEEANDTFRWGDSSFFAFQLSDGNREGFAFIGRKGKKIFFIDCWGVLLEEKEEIEEFLGPHLERFEKEAF